MKSTYKDKNKKQLLNCNTNIDNIKTTLPVVFIGN